MQFSPRGFTTVLTQHPAVDVNKESISGSQYCATVDVTKERRRGPFLAVEYTFLTP